MMFSFLDRLGDGIAQWVERRTCSPDELERVRGFETRPIQLSRHSPWYRVVGTTSEPDEVGSAPQCLM